jgi:dihydropteroate synthase
MIYKLLQISPDEALNGTTVLNTVALMKGASLLRVHDAKEAIEVVKIVEQIKKA